MSKVPGGGRKLTTNKNRIEMDRHQVMQKWSGQAGVKLTVPPNSTSLLERDNHLRGMIQELCGEGKKTVCEVGCGYGRVAKLFPADKYIGVDINPACIAAAMANNPAHPFKTILWDEQYPLADTYLFFTVLLHIPDAELDELLAKIPKGSRVVVSECMFRGVRAYANGFNFQRDPMEYEIAFSRIGKELHGFYHLPLKVFPYFINIMVFG